MEQALSFAGVGDLLEVGWRASRRSVGDEVGEGVADHLLDGAADALGAVGVDGEEVAVEVVGADHAERAFDELAVAGFALAQGGFGGALHGDVDAGGDDEGDLALLIERARWRTRRCGGGCRRG